MQKRRFSKKNILGIIKTYHAKKRQIQRNVTDGELANILQNGQLRERADHDVVITLDGYDIYLNHDQDKIITVTAPDKEAKNSKVISSKEGRDIKKSIQKSESEKISQDEEEMSFDEYMKSEFK